MGIYKHMEIRQIEEKDIETAMKIYNSNVNFLNPYRLTFAFNQKDNNYYFKGVFFTDENKSTVDNH